MNKKRLINMAAAAFFAAVILPLSVSAEQPSHALYDFEDGVKSPFTGNGAVTALENGDKVLRSTSGHPITSGISLPSSSWTNYQVEYDVYSVTTTENSTSLNTRIGYTSYASSYSFEYKWEGPTDSPTKASLVYHYLSYANNTERTRKFGDYTPLTTTANTSTTLTSADNGIPLLDMTRPHKFKAVWKTDDRVLEFWIDGVRYVSEVDDHEQRGVTGGGVRFTQSYRVCDYDNIVIQPITLDVSNTLKCFNSTNGEEISPIDPIPEGVAVKVAGDITCNLDEYSELDLILAVYDVNDMLVDYKIRTLNFSNSDTQDVEETLTAPPDSKITAFIWSDSNDTMISIMRPIELH